MKKLTWTLVVLAVILRVSSVYAGDLSRGEALKILKKTSMGEVTIAITDVIEMRDSRYKATQRVFSLLGSNGYGNVSNYTREGRNYVRFTPNDKLKPYIIQFYAYHLTIKVGENQAVKITGISGLPGDNTGRVVEYVAQTVLNGLGNDIASAITTQEEAGQIVLRKYDDGWRVSSY